jgi:hypothetical protein
MGESPSLAVPVTASRAHAAKAAAGRGRPKDGGLRHTASMERPLYHAARAIAGRLEAHFGRSEEGPGVTRAPRPDAAVIESMVDAAFWASLQREEGYAPEISLVFLPPDDAVHPLRLAAPLRLGPRALSRLAPAVERPGIHLGVWRDEGGLAVWGTTREVPRFCFVVEVLGPGLLVVKQRLREDSAKFHNVAVLEGDEIKVLAAPGPEVTEHSPLLMTLVDPELSDSTEQADDVLLRLAVSMRAHQRGGLLLIVPSGSDAWRESILQPITYAVSPPFGELADLVREAAEKGPAFGAHEALGDAIDAVAGLTAVDGATVITDRFEVLAFGAKISRSRGRPRVEEVMLTEPVEGGAVRRATVNHVGGTRHVAATQFAQDQQDAIALVASQDGRFTLFAWSPRWEMVHGHRLEALLL